MGISAEEKEFNETLDIFTHYVIDADNRTIRFFHGDIGSMSYYFRALSRYEMAMKRFEMTMIVATGLKRISKTHDNLRGFVDYKINSKLFKRAAVAVRMSHGKPNERFFDS